MYVYLFWYALSYRTPPLPSRAPKRELCWPGLHRLGATTVHLVYSTAPLLYIGVIGHLTARCILPVGYRKKIANGVYIGEIGQ